MTREEAWIQKLARSEQYVKMVDKLYQDAIKEAIRLGYSVTVNPDKPFEFKDFPQLTQRVKDLFKTLHDKVSKVIMTSTANEWEYANLYNDALVNNVLKTVAAPKDLVDKYLARNLDALTTFQARKINGMSLSERVWNLTSQFKEELERALDVSLGEGRTAQQASQDVRQYLNEPNKLFRRVRDHRGVLQLSKKAKAYRPGQGVYRSSYKNAMRLTRTEPNIAFRRSDYDRWQSMDFVVGFEVKRSNHVYDCDVCEAFTGHYPKNYIFTGQHPHCRCVAIPILATKDEMEVFFADQINGVTNPIVSAKKVTKMPKSWQEWIKDNEARVLRARQPPYFIKDNFINGDIRKGLKFM